MAVSRNKTTISNAPTNFWPTQAFPATDVCQVNITYTHIGWNDTIVTYAWVPISLWNGRLMDVGGGGFAGGNLEDVAFANSRGWAGVTTDAGHKIDGSDVPD